MRWISSRNFSNVDVFYSIDEGNFVKTATVPNSGYYDWLVPEVKSNAKFTIQLSGECVGSLSKPVTITVKPALIKKVTPTRKATVTPARRITITPTRVPTKKVTVTPIRRITITPTKKPSL